MDKFIKDTFYAEFFFEEEKNIFLLAENSAAHIWETYIDKTSDNYFHLADNHWIIKSQQNFITNWLTDFNNEFSDRIKEILGTKLLWNDEDIVWFCINKHTILESIWSEFKQKWINFLYCENDVPLILNKFDKTKILIVRPIGDIVFIKRPGAG
jgi:Protein of unknown function (DUF2947)